MLVQIKTYRYRLHLYDELKDQHRQLALYR